MILIIKNTHVDYELETVLELSKVGHATFSPHAIDLSYHDQIVTILKGFEFDFRDVYDKGVIMENGKEVLLKRKILKYMRIIND